MFVCACSDLIYFFADNAGAQGLVRTLSREGGGKTLYLAEGDLSTVGNQKEPPRPAFLASWGTLDNMRGKGEEIGRFFLSHVPAMKHTQHQTTMNPSLNE